jgi:hypothetical protein
VLPLLPDDWRPVANLAAALTDAGRASESVPLLVAAERRWPEAAPLRAELARARAALPVAERAADDRR